MGVFEKLTSFIKINADFSKLKSIKFIGDKNTVGLINISKNELNINVNSDELKDPEIRRKLLELIHDEVHVENKPVLEVKASEVVSFISETSTNEELVEYFKGKIPDADIPILRAALVVRHLHEENKPVDNYLGDIRYKYGQHGANIANLCSAGYFETHIKPMYEELSTRPNFTPEMFLGNYQLVVDSAPFAVFVSRTDTVSELIAQVVKKLEFNKMYGLKKINIHGIGAENVKKVEELLADKALNNLFTDTPSVIVEGGVINAAIFY